MPVRQLALSHQVELSVGPSATPTIGRVARDPLGWLACFLSFTTLLLIPWSTTQGDHRLTMLTNAAFIGPWCYVVLRRPRTALSSVLQNWGVLALPILALVSYFWSDYPAATLKSSAEFVLTTMIGIWAGCCIRPRLLMSALLSALLLIPVLGWLRATALHSEIVPTLIAMFGSKNFFALAMACLILTAVCVLQDASQPSAFRIGGIVAAIIAAPLLVYAHSLDALVGAAATIMLAVLLRMTRRLAPAPRLAVLVIAMLTLFIIPVLGSLEFSFADLLGYFGKDVTLTGRTELWENAQVSISARPILGMGYQAYWQAGNWGAEQLWLFAGLHEKTGYHFHNTFLQVTVDLGYVGLVVLLLTFLVVAGRIMLRLSGSVLASPQIFAITVFLFLVLRSPLEVDLFWPFQLPSILISLIWSYLQPTMVTRLRIRARCRRALCWNSLARSPGT